MRALSGHVAQAHGIPPALQAASVCTRPTCARSSKRTVRLISGVALDECLDREHYPARVPFRAVMEGVRIDEELARKGPGGRPPIASANLAPSANSGRSPA